MKQCLQCKVYECRISFKAILRIEQQLTNKLVTNFDSVLNRMQTTRFIRKIGLLFL